MPYRNPTNKMLILILYVGVLFWLLPIVVPITVLQAAINSIVFGIAIAVLTTWGPSGYYALRGNVTAEHQHIVATVAVWLIVFVQRVYAMVFVTLDKPMWLQNTPWSAFISYMFGMTGVFIIIAPLITTKQVDGVAYKWQVAVGTIIGTVLAALSFIIQMQ
jgi:hypothetical protein